VNASTAVVHLEADDEETDITLQVNREGRLQRMTVRRWNADPEVGPVGYLPFVSEDFADERTFGGYTIPTRSRAGWRLGDDDEFAFFFPLVEEAEYPGSSDPARSESPTSRRTNEVGALNR